MYAIPYHVVVAVAALISSRNGDLISPMCMTFSMNRTAVVAATVSSSSRIVTIVGTEYRVNATAVTAYE